MNKRLICFVAFFVSTFGLSLAQLKVQRLDYIIKQNDSLQAESKFVVSNFQKSNESFLLNNDSILKHLSVADVPSNNVQLRGQKTVNNKRYDFGWMIEEDCYSFHASYLGNEIPVFSFFKKQFEHINSSVLIWEEINANPNDPNVFINHSKAHDTFPFYNEEELVSININLDSLFGQYDNDFSTFKKVFKLETEIEVSLNTNNLDVVVNSEFFALEKDKLKLEITSINGKVFYSDNINFNQKYSIPISHEEKIFVYKISFDGILMVTKKIAR